MSKPRNKMPRDKDGFGHGYWKTYDDNGQLIFKGQCVHGFRYGLCTWYDGNGKIYNKEYSLR